MTPYAPEQPVDQPLGRTARKIASSTLSSHSVYSMALAVASGSAKVSGLAYLEGTDERQRASGGDQWPDSIRQANGSTVADWAAGTRQSGQVCGARQRYRSRFRRIVLRANDKPISHALAPSG